MKWPGFNKVIARYKVPSRSQNGITWEVSVFEDGSMLCACPAYKKNCNHIQVITEHRLHGNSVSRM